MVTDGINCGFDCERSQDGRGPRPRTGREERCRSEFGSSDGRIRGSVVPSDHTGSVRNCDIAKPRPFWAFASSPRRCGRARRQNTSTRAKWSHRPTPWVPRASCVSHVPSTHHRPTNTAPPKQWTIPSWIMTARAGKPNRRPAVISRMPVISSAGPITMIPPAPMTAHMTDEHRGDQHQVQKRTDSRPPTNERLYAGTGFQHP